MREIKFRGKNLLGQWSYGDLVRGKIGQRKETAIKVGTKAIFVLEDTIGQYTGLKDKNGKEIYEGDILYTNKYDKKHGIVRWNEELGALHIYNVPSKTLRNARLYEVIGNIYDNPELLGG